MPLSVCCFPTTQEVALCIEELKSPGQLGTVVEEFVMNIIDMKATEQVAIGCMVCELVTAAEPALKAQHICDGYAFCLVNFFFKCKFLSIRNFFQSVGLLSHCLDVWGNAMPESNIIRLLYKTHDTLSGVVLGRKSYYR